MIKKILLMTALAAGTAASASAQGFIEETETIYISQEEVLRPAVFSIGPKVDFNYAIAGNPKNASNETMRVDMKGGAGFNAGLVGNVRFGRPAGRPYGTERFGVQLELLYSMRNLNNNVEKITFNNFEIPLLFQWYFIPELALEVGPTFTGAFSVSPNNWDYGNSTLHPNKFKPFDVMASFGLNCKLRNGFMAEFRYNLGTSNVDNHFKTKVSTISIGVGWLFNVIK